MWLHFPSVISVTWHLHNACWSPSFLSKAEKEKLSEEGAGYKEHGMKITHIEVGKYIPIFTYWEEMKIKYSLTKEALYHIINRYALSTHLLKYIYVKLDKTRV